MSNPLKERPATGRRLPRVGYVCESCQVRRAIGQPKPNPAWAQRLRLSQVQVDALLLAAVEFDQLCDEAGEYSTAVAFVDWFAPDALGGGKPHEYVLSNGEYRKREDAA